MLRNLFFVSSALMCFCLAAGCGAPTGVTVTEPAPTGPTSEELQKKEMDAKKAGGAYDGTFKTDMSKASEHDGS